MSDNQYPIDTNEYPIIIEEDYSLDHIQIPDGIPF